MPTVNILQTFFIYVGATLCFVGSIALATYILWSALEAILAIENRILIIIRVQPALVRYLRNAKLYDKLIDEHKTKIDL